MNRRSLLLAGAVLPFFYQSGWAASEARKDFHWRHPGAHRYTGTSDQALNLLSDLLPKEIREEFRRQIADKHGFSTLIPNNFRFTRMVFGTGQTVSNVIAETDAWPASATRRAIKYTARRGSLVYVLVRPEVCQNYSLAVCTIAGECIKDHPVCDANCQRRLHKN